MQAVCTLIILAILCTSVLCALGSQSTKTAGQKSKTNVRESLPKGSTCGISATAPNIGRIVGGEEAKPHSWPWQVFIQCLDGIDGYFCGGSIISDKWIITAAHCVKPDYFNMSRLCQVFLGKHDRKRNESTQLIANISQYFIHPKYSENSDTDDLALFKLTNPVRFTDAIQPICLPFGLPELPFNKSCYATGWGDTQSENGKLSVRLKQLPMTVSMEYDCSYPIGRLLWRLGWTVDMPSIICAARWDGGKDVCYGDSGGPLACQEQDRKWYLRGVVVNGPTVCDLWAIFTKVTFFEEWIKSITSRY